MSLLMEATSNWRHDDLQHDLANHFRTGGERLVWENMQMGPMHSARPDVFVLQKSYSKFRPLTYEVKISVSDFRSDITSGKWLRYLDFSCGVYFAVPAGLINKSSIPDGCGLIARSQDGWRVLKAPTLKALDTLPRDSFMKLLIDGIDRAVGERYGPRQLSQWDAAHKVGKRHGEKIGQLLSELASAETRLIAQINEAERRRKEIAEGISIEVANAVKWAARDVDSARAEIQDLGLALGLAPDARTSQITAELRKAARRLSVDGEITHLRNCLRNAREVLDAGCTEIGAEKVCQETFE